MYIVLSILLILAGLVFWVLGLGGVPLPVIGFQFTVHGFVVPILLLNIFIGAIAIIARYKALEQGKASIISPLSKSYVLLVILIGVIFLGETLTLGKAFGSLLILVSAAIISFEGKSIKGFKLEQGVPFLAITIIGWSIYYSLLKPIVAALGPFQATLFLEIGITAMVLSYAVLRKKNTSLPNQQASQFILANGFLVFIGSMMYNFSVASIGVVLTAIILSATPAVNLIASRILLKEKLSAMKYAAILLLVLGLAVLFGFQ
jgi:drug/metabolite transporter (DMT)-like permease